MPEIVEQFASGARIERDDDGSIYAVGSATAPSGEKITTRVLVQRPAPRRATVTETVLGGTEEGVAIPAGPRRSQAVEAARLKALRDHGRRPPRAPWERPAATSARDRETPEQRAARERREAETRTYETGGFKIADRRTEPRPPDPRQGTLAHPPTAAHVRAEAERLAAEAWAMHDAKVAGMRR